MLCVGRCETTQNVDIFKVKVFVELPFLGGKAHILKLCLNASGFFGAECFHEFLGLKNHCFE